MSNLISIISTNNTLSLSQYTSTIRFYMADSVSSATLTSSPGKTFIDGSTSIETTGYVTVGANPINSNVWNIRDESPYTGFAEVSSLRIDALGVRSTLYVKGYTDCSGSISSLGTFTTPSLTQLGRPVVSTSNLASTVNGLGNFYISTGPSNIASTIAGLGSSGYTSTVAFFSTFNGLGSRYVSTPSVVSTLTGYSNYALRSNLISTVNGLGSAPTSYISTPSLVSTVTGLSNTYITSNMKISTVASFTSAEATSLASTFQNMGQYYISTPTIHSTVSGLGGIYISSPLINSFVANFATGVIQPLLNQMVANLGTFYISTPHLVSTTSGLIINLSSNVTTLGYVSTPQLFSTVAGLGSLPGTSAYISTASLVSTVSDLERIQSASLLSTVAGLGSLPGTGAYISSGTVTSTITGLSNIFSSNLVSTFQGLGSGAAYISTAQLVSTVQGLGSAPGSYISTASLVSSSLGFQVSALQTIVNTAGQTYVSTSGLVSTTTGLRASYSNALLSTAQGLGSLPAGQGYISTPQLVSTVNGLGSGAAYISTASLVSSYIGYGASGLQRVVDTAGQTYVSTSGLVSTTTGLRTSFSNALLSTAQGLGSLPAGQAYISTAQLVSTVQGLGSAPGSYISTASLVSSYVAYINSEFQRITDTSGLFYVSTPGLVSTRTGLLTGFSNTIISTFQGLGTSGYISTGNLVSTVQGLGSLPASYISTPSLVSTYSGYIAYNQAQVTAMVAALSNVYLLLTRLTSTSTGLQSSFSNDFFSTLNGLGNSGFIRLSDLNLLVTTLGNNGASQSYVTNTLTVPFTNYINNASNTYTVAAQNAYFTRENLVSTTSGLNDSLSNSLVTTFTNLNAAGYINLDNLRSTVIGISENGIQPSQFTSTTAGYSNAQLASLISMLITAGQTYVSTSGLVSTTTGLQTSFSNALVSTTQGLGSLPAGQAYISTPQLVSTFQGLGSAPGSYISTASLTSTFTSLTNSFAAAAIPLFENSLGSIYISTPGLVSTVIGLSNTYIMTPQLTSTVNGLGNFYISTPQLTSTISAIFVSQSNEARQILTSTVEGLGRTYLSTLLLQNYIFLTNLPALNTMVATIAYSNTVNLFSNGYIYYTSPFTLTTTSNFYEGSNISMINTPTFVVGSTIATTVRTIGYGSNYLYGDGSYMTVSSDRRLKEDIQPIPSVKALEQVTSMRGVYYKKIGDSNSYIGCIAQEVEEVFPQVITTHPSVEPKDLKSMKYEFLLAPLLESVKELANTHSTLKYFVEKKYGNIQ